MTGWQDVEGEVLRRIRAGLWPPGSAIPHEADLAAELGVSRATVNRALQTLAGDGWLVRRRRAGTRVADPPVRRATLSIPVIRAEIEATGATYGYRLLGRREGPDAAGARRLGLGPEARILSVEALHLADGCPWAHEDRAINPAAVPAIAAADLGQISANEWLVRHAPFSRGTWTAGAARAGALAPLLGCAEDSALLVVERATWAGEEPVTAVTLSFAPGHVLSARL